MMSMILFVVLQTVAPSTPPLDWKPSGFPESLTQQIDMVNNLAESAVNKIQGQTKTLEKLRVVVDNPTSSSDEILSAILEDHDAIVAATKAAVQSLEFLIDAMRKAKMAKIEETITEEREKEFESWANKIMTMLQPPPRKERDEVIEAAKKRLENSLKKPAKNIA